MMFSTPKKISVEVMISDIQTIVYLIQELSHHIGTSQEVQPYFDKVELRQQQVSNNLIKHSKLLHNIQLRLRDRNTKTNLRSVDHLLGYLKKWFDNYKEQQKHYSHLQKTTKALQLQGKLNCLQQFMDHALIFEDDITSFPLGFSPKYYHIYRKIQVLESLDIHKTRRDYRTFKDLITITNASVLSELKQTNSFLGIVTFGLSYPRFYMDHKEAQLRNQAFLRKPQLQKLLSIWNLPEKGAISGLKYIQYPPIKTNKLIYIPLDQANYQFADLFNPSERTVPVRILSNRQVIFWNQHDRGCFNLFNGSSNQQMTSVIIHAHGGGFVALSSSTMQNYTRIWSKQLDTVVFSIDYCKPPRSTFPAPVYDVYAVYKFISNEIYKFCNILPRKIVLAGDSAGGNLVISAYALAMKAKLKPVQGFFLAYPASDLRSCYTPSRLSSFTDAILHPSLLLLCLKEYLGQYQKDVEDHPLASPLLTSQAFIGGKEGDNRWPLDWPVTRIIVGELDPLLDDSVRLTGRMVDSGVDVGLKIYRQLGHGFLSVQNVVREGQRGIKDSVLLLRQILNYRKGC